MRVHYGVNTRSRKSRRLHYANANASKLVASQIVDAKQITSNISVNDESRLDRKREIDRERESGCEREIYIEGER